ncbi:DivIVA domain-containing protein [Pseudonocardia broussonetiae]|uniref:Cell wall synthesis protein Wag31 n=1 Tax=Pseudonocardia broussonetiae TaxID=2736640 RepID=A0A6M6JQA1_9PSEU|nr:DivIVA domain-containing protein [Pseudonocardia broussonetiae]QJY49525.1 DivIVA domain-containing protein [Pseudonocardia broussonetiae]
MPLTPADVHNVAFSKPPIGKRGYNEDEVDAFLDLVEAELARLIEENEDLREQVSELEQRLGNAQADLEEARSRPPAAMAAPVSPPTQQIQRQVEPPPMRPPMEPQRSMSAPPPQMAEPSHDTTGDHHVQVAKVLSMAQEMAERLTAEAKSEADSMLSDARTKSEQLLSEARTKSDGLVNDARARAETMLNDARTRAETLERQSRDKAASLVGDAERKQNEIIGSITREKTVLEKKIDELRTFEREYRTRLKTYLESQLRDLEGRGSAAPTDGRNTRDGGYAATGYGQRADAGS